MFWYLCWSSSFSLDANLIQVHCLWKIKLHNDLIATTEAQTTKGRMSYDQLLGQWVLELRELTYGDLVGQERLEGKPRGSVCCP